jgi:predicted RNA-binding Zn ribbon-like protein
MTLEPSSNSFTTLGGRLAVDFVNARHSQAELSWEDLVRFLEVSRIVSSERGTRLLGLPQTDPQAAAALLRKSWRLRSSLRRVFAALIDKHRLLSEWIEPINDVLRVTEGHDELIQEGGEWRIEFQARESGLDWLLAAIARSAAEIIVEDANIRIRLCANTHCGLFFYDLSRTHRRRWCSMAVCGNRSKVAAFARKHGPSRHNG